MYTAYTLTYIVYLKQKLSSTYMLCQIWAFGINIVPEITKKKAEQVEHRAQGRGKPHERPLTSIHQTANKWH